ncbi:hypothetical protein NDU88_007982 [Pleurodeles waltl]|uniref:Uncharacterized protein n=1 Tax=Pleurodeles waltl TaxID=8319 RepID=A0AAV7RRN9_PLEWA|nr:hypothetical protein NDU88_007982 [Pleurodeles waltl]
MVCGTLLLGATGIAGRTSPEGGRSDADLAATPDDVDRRQDEMEIRYQIPRLGAVAAQELDTALNLEKVKTALACLPEESDNVTCNHLDEAGWAQYGQMDERCKVQLRKKFASGNVNMMKNWKKTCRFGGAFLNKFVGQGVLQDTSSEEEV